MPPIFGMMLLAILVIALAFVCLSPFLLTAAFPDLRDRPGAWRVALIPAGLVACCVLVFSGSCYRDSLLVDAVQMGDAKGVQTLLDQGVSADTTMDFYDSGTVVLRAIQDRRWDIVKLLADHGATDSFWGDDDLPDQRASSLLKEAHQDELARQILRNTKAKL